MDVGRSRKRIFEYCIFPIFKSFLRDRKLHEATLSFLLILLVRVHQRLPAVRLRASVGKFVPFGEEAHGTRQVENVWHDVAERA